MATLILTGSVEAVWADVLHRTFESAGRRCVAPDVLFLAAGLASMTTLLNIAERADNLFDIENFIARETVGDGGRDSSAPKLPAGRSSPSPTK